MERYRKILSEHLKFIEKSAYEFDRGDTSEALRIATSLRVIFHQTTKSKALLEHLNAWDVMLLTASDLKVLKEGVPDAPVFLFELPQVYPNEEQGNNEYVPVRQWWNEDPVSATQGIWITRKDIVMWVANKDGGTHVDEVLPPNYTFSMNSGLSYTGPDKSTGEIVRQPAQTPFVKLRQIAHEVLNSPALFELANKPFVANIDITISWFNTGFNFLNIGQNQDALDAFDKVLNVKPGYAMAWHFKGIALMELDRSQEALDAFTQSLAIKQDNVTAWCYKAMILGNSGRDQDALEASDKALAVKPDSVDAWHCKGIALCNLGRDEEALNAYKKALDIKPDYADAWNDKGISLGRLGKDEEALNAFNQALAIKADYKEAWHFKGIALSRLGMHQEAKECADRARILKSKRFDHSSRFGGFSW